jgi:hypothetical protein
MAKIAKLVTLTLQTRVVVEEGTDDEEVMELARPKFADKIKYEYLENIEEVIEDKEQPYKEGEEDEE